MLETIMYTYWTLISIGMIGLSFFKGGTIKITRDVLFVVGIIQLIISINLLMG